MTATIETRHCWIPQWPRGWHPRHRRASAIARREFARFSHAHSPAIRGIALRDLAHCGRELAAAEHTRGASRRRGSDGYTTSEVHAMSARLLDLIAGTEDALDQHRPYQPAGDPFEITARPALDQLTKQREPAARADLALEVHRRVVSHAGARAADVLIRIAAGYRHLEALHLASPAPKELATR